VTASLHEQMPDLSSTVAIDASDMPAYANGQRYLYKGGPDCAVQSSASSAGSRTSGRCCPCGSGASSGSGCTPI
jgi:hypothetical protein